MVLITWLALLFSLGYFSVRILGWALCALVWLSLMLVLLPVRLTRWLRRRASPPVQVLPPATVDRVMHLDGYAYSDGRVVYEARLEDRKHG